MKESTLLPNPTDSLPVNLNEEEDLDEGSRRSLRNRLDERKKRSRGDPFGTARLELQQTQKSAVRPDSDLDIKFYRQKKEHHLYQNRD